LLANDNVEGLAEDGWLDGGLRVGNACLGIVSRAPRCVMTSHAQPGLERDPTVIRTIVQQLRSNFSAYAEMTAPGLVRLGDQAVPFSPEAVEDRAVAQ
jgi:uncharacterized protein YcbX